MKNEISDRFEAEIWAEIGSDYIIENWEFYTICKATNPLAPLRVLVAASTGAGVTTRLKTKQARQHQLASLSFLAHVSRVFSALAFARS